MSDFGDILNGEKGWSYPGLLGPKAIAATAIELKSPVDAVLDYVAKVWPELATLPDLWISGGQVWRRFYGVPVDTKHDVDLFATNEKTFSEACDILVDIQKDAGDFESYMTPLGGKHFWTKRGRVDIWQDDKAYNTLKKYSDERKHARMAVNIKRRYMMVLPSEVVRKAGDQYIKTNPDGTVSWVVE